MFRISFCLTFGWNMSVEVSLDLNIHWNPTDYRWGVFHITREEPKALYLHWMWMWFGGHALVGTWYRD